MWQLVRSLLTWAWDIFFSFVGDQKAEVHVFVELIVNLPAPLKGEIWPLVPERVEPLLCQLVSNSPEDSGHSFMCHLIVTTIRMRELKTQEGCEAEQG